MWQRCTATICIFLFAYIITGCVAVALPILPGDGINKVEVDVEKLIESNATKIDVVYELGKPLKYRADSMSYKACRESGGVALLSILPGSGYEEFIGDYVCVELLLNFDQYNILIGYEENSWSGRIDAEKENNILLSLANQGDVFAKQLLEKSGQYDWVKTLGSTDDQLETFAAQGNAEAQLQLYWNNPTDEQAFQWLCHAADQGNTEARYRLGVLHENGSEGCPKNPLVAYMWYKLSAYTGNYMRAADQANRLYAKMTIEQKQQSDEFVQKWEPGQCQRELADQRSGI